MVWMLPGGGHTAEGTILNRRIRGYDLGLGGKKQLSRGNTYPWFGIRGEKTWSNSNKREGGGGEAQEPS